MKGIRLLFAACLASLILDTAVSFAATNASRGVPRRATPAATTTTETRERANTSSRRTTASTVTSRTTATTPIRERTVTTSSRGVSTRTAAPTKAKTSRATTTPTRATRAAATASRSAVTSRTGATRASGARLTNRGRSATPQTITREEILSRDVSKCRTVFYECMDEFCANKDAQLKRCACSNRINEFRGLQENLDLVEDQLLEFGQRLLTVSMEKEDAAVLNQATEGELAFNQDDRSESKKQLDEIAKKLNNSFNNNDFDQNLNAISLSLDIDAAFDTVDSMAGASTTTKSGTALYSAALPVCREMALEVCSSEELSMIESGYQMLIEQDCNTVKKSFQTQSDQARAKVLENSALLDMSRLDIYQQRNSDDILTCKSKMLDMLTNSTVCGENLSKCLDTSGQYINPTTGAAILSTNLTNLSSLISRPTSGNETWVNLNSRYVKFLNSKKKFLEPAMENCQDISDTVWQEFLGDALAQIKLAQEEKLEQIRQSCTTLTTQCLDTALQTITEFDERALSIFGVTANKTVTAMCTEINTACTALFRATDGSGNNSDNRTDWETGIEEITLEKTYETLMSTCREVGRNCIIQNCSAGSDQFGLCNDVYSSSNRHSILERKLCWGEVLACINEAGSDTIDKIISLKNITTDTPNYTDRYNLGTDTVEDICLISTDKKVCRLAEMIWGNCTQTSTTEDGQTSEIRNILLTYKDSQYSTALNETSLLSWFAYQTTTSETDNNCSVTHCPNNYTLTADGCMPTANLADDQMACQSMAYHFNATQTTTNCCSTGLGTNRYDNSNEFLNTTCCATENSINPQSTNLDSGESTYNNVTGFFNTANNLNYLLELKPEEVDIQDSQKNQLGVCRQPTAQSRPIPLMHIKIGNTDFMLLCNPDKNTSDIEEDGVKCSGKYVLSTKEGILVDPYELFENGNTNNAKVYSYFYPGKYKDGKCIYKCEIDGTSQDATQNEEAPLKINGSCEWSPTTTKISCTQAPTGWSIEYTDHYLR